LLVSQCSKMCCCDKSNLSLSYTVHCWDWLCRCATVLPDERHFWGSKSLPHVQKFNINLAWAWTKIQLRIYYNMPSQVKKINFGRKGYSLMPFWSAPVLSPEFQKDLYHWMWTKHCWDWLCYYRTQRVTLHCMMLSARNVMTCWHCCWSMALIWVSPTTMDSTHSITQHCVAIQGAPASVVLGTRVYLYLLFIDIVLVSQWVSQ